MGRKLVEQIEGEKGIKAKLEYDTDLNNYVMTVEYDGKTMEFTGTMKEIQNEASKYFIKSLRSLKNRLEIALLEDMLNKEEQEKNL